MINTDSVFNSRVKIQQIVDSQVPEFIKEENPLTIDFLKSYYTSQEFPGGPVDLAENLDSYIKLDSLTPDIISGMSAITAGISTTDTEIFVTNTKGFPTEYGLIRLDSEVISYTGVTTNSFTGCLRGFSGITSYRDPSDPSELVFSTSDASEHISGTAVQNLSALFLKEFYKKLKALYAPGLEDTPVASGLDVNNFIKESKSLYQTKGTEESIKILMKVLYGIDSKVIDLEQFLSKPSFAEYIRREIIVARLISGDPRLISGTSLFTQNPALISGTTLFQDANPSIEVGAASGPVSEIEIFSRGSSENIGIQTYYKISLFTGFDDSPLIEGKFVIPGSSFTIGEVGAGGSIITVDSTIGFPESGTFNVGVNTVTYTDKTITQFFGCEGVIESISPRSEVIQDTFVYAYESNDLTKPVRFFVTGVLSELDTEDQSIFSAVEGSKISVKSLGKVVYDNPEDTSYSKVFFNSWIYNSSARYFVSTFSGSTFNLESPIAKSSLKLFDFVDILDRNSQNIVASNLEVVNVNLTDNAITLGAGDYSQINPLGTYDVRKRINTATSNVTPIALGNNVVASDVLNTYIENEEFGYAASNSLPNYAISPSITSVTISVASTSSGSILNFDSNSLSYNTLSFQDALPFFTGDEVYYEPGPGVKPIVGLTTGVYYVSKEPPPNNNRCKLALSRSFLAAGSFVSFNEVIDGPHYFTLAEQREGKVQPQKLLKKFPLSQRLTDGVKEETLPGSTGMLINGVEIVNYKVDDSVFYGPLDRTEVFNGGSNYDAVTPPNVVVDNPSVSTGTTARIQAVVEGSFTDILVDPVNFDIEEVLAINITGGNGSGARASATLASEFREAFFDAQPITQNGGVDITANTITFDAIHPFQTGDPIVYSAQLAQPLGISSNTSNDEIQGLTLQTGSIYYAGFINSRTIQLYNNQLDALTGINTIGITTENNSGVMKFRTTEKKLKIDRINVLNPGQGYSNRKLVVQSSGIRTEYDTVNFDNHNFSNGDIVEYEFSDTAVSGLSSDTKYKILVVDSDTFRLANAGTAGTDVTNFNRGKFVNMTNVGVGSHIFKYPDVAVTISAVTTQQQEGTFTATPVIRGPIVDAYLYEPGTDYGSEILNFERTPEIEINSGKGAEVKPVVLNGRIDSVFVLSGGSGYTSPPELVVQSNAVGIATTGSGARLRAQINSAGIVTSVVVLSGGVNYDANTTVIRADSVGSGANLNGFVRRLRVNKFAKNNNNSGEIISPTPDQGLEYAAIGYGITLRDAFEDSGSFHSPLIGWAYDGNPVYGSFGYNDPEDIQSGTRRMESGYVQSITHIENRPSSVTFPAGFFVDDFKFNNSGDLDEFNGRFSITNEFPQGVYAYYGTIDSSNNPEFPFFIGNSFRSKAISENINPADKIDQSFDFNNSKLIRNTFPHKIAQQQSAYDFVIEPYKIFPQDSIVDDLSSGSVDFISVASTGNARYAVGDNINFDETEVGTGVAAEISRINGRTITSIASTEETYENAIVTWKNDSTVEVSIKPNFDLLDNDIVQVTGLSTFVAGLNGSQEAGIGTNQAKLVVGVGSTGVSGMVTDIQVSFVPVSFGSSITVSNETMGILNVFEADGILRVQRYANESGIAHTATENVNFLPQRFEIKINTPYFQSREQDEIFFNPFEVVGIGSTAGIATTRSYQFNGITTIRSIPTQSIFLQNHPFVTNQELDFTVGSAAGAIGISTSPSQSQFDMPSVVYAVVSSKDHVGIATVLNGPSVFFRDVTGTDSYDYKLTTKYPQVTADIKKIKATVTTGESHGLVNGDKIELNVKPGITTGVGAASTVTVKILDEKLLINPVAISSAGVNVTTNVITQNSHGFISGDKVYYETSESIGGLTTGSYFVYTVDTNNFQLADTKKDIFSSPPRTITLTSAGGHDHTFSLINPPLEIFKNNNVEFNLSDSTLTGYNFRIYYTDDYKNRVVSTGSTTEFLITEFGTPGTVGAGVTLEYSDNFPSILYYNLEKSGYISTSDVSVLSNNQIQYYNSKYNGSYKVTDVSSNTFDVNLNSPPERDSYVRDQIEKLEYTTDSLTATGGITDVKLIFEGLDYRTVPSISSITSDEGVGAILRLNSSSIGKLEGVRLLTQGFSYPSDKTLKPEAAIPNELTVQDYQTLDSVTVVSGGRNYLTPPSLILFDPEEGTVVPEFDGTVELAGSSVSPTTVIDGVEVAGIRIDRNPVGLDDESVYRIIPVNNDNGVSIVSVASSTDNTVTLSISTPILGFSTAPFANGDLVFVEGIGLASTDGQGHNSSDYDYAYFTITNYNSSANPNTLTYSLSSFVSGGNNTGIAITNPGFFANVIKKDNLAEFSIQRKSSTFIPGEALFLNDDFVIGSVDLFVSSFNDLTGKLNVTGITPIKVGDRLTGSVSGSRCTISDLSSKVGRFNVDSTSKFTKGWSNEIGFLDEDYQVTSDNDYYQRMSYSVQSVKSFDDVISYVNDIVHPAGYRNFVDMQIDPTGNVGASFTTAQEDPFLVIDVYDGAKRVDSVNDFDYVRDVDATTNTSKSIEFENIKVSDFILNKSNRVLSIDDISDNFLNENSEDLIDFTDTGEWTEGRQTNKFIVQTVDATNSNELSLKEIVLITNNQDTFALEKVGLGDSVGEFDGVYDSDDNQYSLRFTPFEPYNTDYDIKILQTFFDDTTAGVGSANVGFVDLISSTDTVSAGASATVIGFSTLHTDSIYSSVEVYDSLTNDIDYYELVLSHSAGDTHLTELAAFNTRVSLSGFSGPFIGSFTSSIDSGVVTLSFTNNGSNDVRIRTQTVGINTSGAGIGTYRFKFTGTIDGSERTARLESGISTTTSGVSTSILGISSITDASVKSTVKVAIGETQAIHQVYVVNDDQRKNLYILTYPFLSIGSTSGVGTFGVDYGVNNIIDVKFYPDITGDVDIKTFNEIVYRDLDNNGGVSGIGDLTYGNVRSNVAQVTYFGINQREVLEFDAKHNSVDIFAKTFDPDSSILRPSDGVFTVEHYFQDGEELSYTPGSNLVGVAATGLVYDTGVGTARLPQTVYAIRDNASQFRVAITTANAIAGTGVTFTSVGTGNKHVLSMVKNKEKAIISIDGIVQSPISKTSLDFTLTNAIGAGATIFELSGISSIRPNDLLKINDEYVKINIVGLGSTSDVGVAADGDIPLVEVTRGFVGSSATSHSADDAVSVYRGAFNIVDSKIHFTSAPKGAGRQDLDERGLTIPRSSFNGRVYLRKNYDSNLIFDDISDQFDGVTSRFRLTSIGTDVTGIGSTGGNGLVLINGIFQAPSTPNNTNNNFSIIENAGISSVVFTGILSAAGGQIVDETDINLNQLPRGGVPISFGSTNGLGYAPIVPAEIVATATNGVITEVTGIPTTGTTVNISTAAYDNLTGILTVTSDGNHTLNVGDKINFSGLEFSCPSESPFHNVYVFPSEQGVNFTISSFDYDNKTGIATVGLTSSHNFSIGRYVDLSNIGFSCTLPHAGVTTTTFPDGSSGKKAIGVNTNRYPILGIAGTNKFVVDVGVSTIAHTYTGSGATAGNAFEVKPAGPYYVDEIISATQFKSQVGVVTFAHTYVGSGNFAKWTTANFGSGYVTVPGVAVTDIAFEHRFVSAGVGSIRQTSFDGTAFTATGATYDSPTGLLVLTIPSHGLTTSNSIGIDTGGIVFTCSSDDFRSLNPYPRSTDPLAGIITSILSVTTNTITIDAHPGGGAGTGAEVTATVGAGGTIAVSIVSGGTGYVNPRVFVDSPSYENLPVTGISRLAIGNTSETGIGMSVTIDVIGINTFFQEKPIVNFEYDETTGLATVTAPDFKPRLNEFIQLRNISFACTAPHAGVTTTIFPDGTQGFDYRVLSIDSDLQQFTTNVGISTIAHTYESGGIVRSGIGATLFEIKEFRITKPGYAFRAGDKVTVVGLATDPNVGDNFRQFEIEILDTFEDTFSSWQFGELDYIDDISALQDGLRARFPLSYNDQTLSFEVDKNDPDSALIDLESLLIVFINGVLQEPGTAYNFDGGTSIVFTEPPVPQDKISIFFYRGKVGTDSLFTNINETIKPGDDIFIKRTPLIEFGLAPNTLENRSQESTRTVIGITSSSETETTLYRGEGVNQVTNKPIIWTKQKVDKILNGEFISKERDSIEAQIYPTASVIKNVTTSDTQIFVDDTSLFLGVDGTDTNFGGVLQTGIATVGFGSTETINIESVGGITNLEVEGYTGLITGITTSAARLEEFFPFDVTKATPNDRVDVSTGINTAVSIAVKDDGSSIFAAGAGGTITEYTMSTPHKINTAVINNSNTIDIRSSVTELYDIYFLADGTKLYTVGKGAQAPFVTQLNQFDLGTAWDLTSIAATGVSTEISIANQTQAHRAMVVTGVGRTVYTLDPATATFYHYQLTIPYDITSLGYVQNHTIVDDNAPYDFSISQDGSKMLIVGGENEQIIEFDLSTDYDITTAVGVETSTIGVGIPTALTIQTSSADGDRAYVLNTTGFTSQYNLSIPAEGLGIVFQLDLQDVPTEIERQKLLPGYRIVVSDTGVGTGLTTLVGSATSVGIGTTNVIGISTDKLDNVYELYYANISGTVGLITCYVDPDTNVVGVATTGSYLEPAGKISWGRIFGIDRASTPLEFFSDGNAFEVGLTTYPTFQRRDVGLRDTGALSKR